LFANIRGEDNSSPILLYLHGGPGSPLGVPILKAYAGPQLENHFLVVYLHQRGIMKSKRVPDSKHSISNYVKDVHYVVNFLKEKFNNRDIYLMGHSWGGLLSYLYLMEYRNEIKKLITICTPLDVELSIKERVNMMLIWAKETNNKEAIEELNGLQDKSLNDIEEKSEILEKWMTRAYGGWSRNLSINRIDDAVDYEDRFPLWLNEQKHIEELMIPELLGVNLMGSINSLSTPLLSIAGAEDTSTPWYVVKYGVDRYKGEKTFVLFENSHHMVFMDEEDLFVEIVLKFLINK
ncbi:MAG: alpha/beta hydrolase, partial [Bacteroidales bacterium]|nr:alpha/beta hydrolase [Bacteroidales bacterium]